MRMRWSLRALLLATPAAVVFALAVLQHRLLERVSEAQGSRATTRVRENLRLITDAFDAEITRAVLAFTIPPVPGQTTSAQLEQAWATWNHDAPWPRIVSGLWPLESSEYGWRPHSWGAGGTPDLPSILTGDDLIRGGS